MRSSVLSVVSSLSLSSAFRSSRSGYSSNLMMSSRPLNTLFVATSVDAASLNIANALKGSSSKWTTHWVTRESSVYYAKTSSSSSSSSSPSSSSSSSGGLTDDRIVWLWIQDQPLLHLNNVDQLLSSQLLESPVPSIPTSVPISESSGIVMSEGVKGVQFDEVIFLSKHCAASGKASLTVHPIGIPWQNDASDSGGFPGRCSPPNKRIAVLYRSILAETKARGMQDQFEVTLEATHHGPYCALPACFVEIGSTDLEWSIPEAGLVWADCLLKHFGIPVLSSWNNIIDSNSDIDSGNNDDGSSNNNGGVASVRDGSSSGSSSGGVVLVTIGGGHYVPKMNDVARFGPGMYTGHSLATYTLQRHLDGTERNPVEGGWKHIVEEALVSTRITHPDADLVVLLDKKAFIAEHKNNIISYLEEMDVEWTHKVSDVKTMWEKKMVAESVSC